MGHAPPSSLISRYAALVARARVYEVALRTSLDAAPRLSRRYSNDIYFKREDLQPVFSFKVRGAFNKMIGLEPDARNRGVICSSAGNHAQGVALAATRMGIRAVVVMPESTPSIKVEAVRALGAEILLAGSAYDEANAHASALAERDGLVFVHPFDDPEVIAGQGTIAAELGAQWPREPDAVFVPVGGGGLIAGIGAYLRHHFPRVRVVGVEPEEAASMQAALAHGAPVDLEQVGIFADGVAVRRVGAETFRVAREVVDEIVLVDTDEICAAIKDVFEDSRGITEPAGALAVAGLKRYLESAGTTGGSYIAINSGANMNFDRLRHVTERAELGERREALLAVEIPERKGAFLDFCRTLGRRNITEFNYRHAHFDSARIFVGVTLKGASHETEALARDLRSHGYGVLDLTENELAILHIRHMVGGRAPGLVDEVVCRFEFPERPGALLAFLESVGTRWNISLFHYRNHGSDYGRVLAGVQVPPGEREEFTRHLRTLGYRYSVETANPAYRLFLSANT